MQFIRRWGLDVAAAMFLVVTIIAGCSVRSSTANRDALPAGEARSSTSPLPYSDVLTYPDDWPDLARRREQAASPNSAKFSQSGGLITGVNGNLTSGFIGEATEARAAEAPSQPMSSTEEFWIISKPAPGVIAEIADATPRSGALVAKQDDKILPFPLKHTDVQARIDGYIASVNVTQQYHNPFDQKIEAVYVFPLPENAAVNEFVMTIGDRTIRGIIREKQEAKQIYEDAKRQGYVASLLEQDRPNIFTQKVANIEPGRQIDISIRYFHTLAFVDGWYEFVFPMVVGPRFNPPATTGGVGAVAKGDAGASGQKKTEVQYLAPGERTGNEVSLNIALNAGVSIEQIQSVNHAINFRNDQKELATVTLREQDRIPNKDFVLRYKVAGDTLKSAVIAQRDGKSGGYFTLMLYPPTTTENLPRRPVDLCFTIDVSGSMTGAPLDQSRKAVRAALSMMQPGDTFNILRFASNTDSLSADPLPATPANLRKAERFIASTNAGGGTMMLDGITRSLNQTVDENRVRYVCMMTDGYIGNEKQIIQATRKLRGSTRVFGFGVGASPNRYLIDGMSRAGAGAVAYLSLKDEGDDVMKPFFERISRPAMTNIEIDSSALKGAQINPFKIPDVYVGRAVVITGRFEGDGGPIVVRGNINGQRVERAFDIRPTDQGTAIASVWARQQIAALSDRAMFDGDIDPAREVKQIALNYNLMSEFTSFVAVDSAQPTAGAVGTTVVQPVPAPEGVKYETTVQEK